MIKDPKAFYQIDFLIGDIQFECAFFDTNSSSFNPVGVSQQSSYICTVCKFGLLKKGERKKMKRTMQH